MTSPTFGDHDRIECVSHDMPAVLMAQRFDGELIEVVVSQQAAAADGEPLTTTLFTQKVVLGIFAAKKKGQHSKQGGKFTPHMMMP